MNTCTLRYDGDGGGGGSDSQNIQHMKQKTYDSTLQYESSVISIAGKNTTLAASQQNECTHSFLSIVNFGGNKVCVIIYDKTNILSVERRGFFFLEKKHYNRLNFNWSRYFLLDQFD